MTDTNGIDDVARTPTILLQIEWVCIFGGLSEASASRARTSFARLSRT
jgi:hypothetical protein